MIQSRRKMCDSGDDGFQTMTEIMAEIGLNRTAASEMVKSLIETGRAVKKVRKVLTGNGITRLVPVYRLKAECAAAKSTKPSTAKKKPYNING